MNDVVNCHNDWDPLEEVIVGVLDGCCTEEWTIAREATVTEDRAAEFRARLVKNAGKLRAQTDPQQYAAAQRDLDEFIHILEAEGVKVRRPDPFDFSRPFTTPDWTCTSSRSASVPRDVMIVLGDEILESSMAWRARYFEFIAYRSLVKEYFKAGARWTAAPKPQMKSDLYNSDFVRGEEYVLTEVEPAFDAADILRIGNQLFIQKSHVTNDWGIEWVRRQYQGRYDVHKVEFVDDRAWHIDATFVPLAPGKMLVNPDRPIRNMPEIFKRGGWEMLECPPTAIPKSDRDYELQKWLHMNIINLDDKRIIVERNEEHLIKALREWGFKPIPCSFRGYYKFGGSFHCATCDVRRRGPLQNYF